MNANRIKTSSVIPIHRDFPIIGANHRTLPNYLTGGTEDRNLNRRVTRYSSFAVAVDKSGLLRRMDRCNPWLKKRFFSEFTPSNAFRAGSERSEGLRTGQCKSVSKKTRTLPGMAGLNNINFCDLCSLCGKKRVFISTITWFFIDQHRYFTIRRRAGDG